MHQYLVNYGRNRYTYLHILRRLCYLTNKRFCSYAVPPYLLCNFPRYPFTTKGGVYLTLIRLLFYFQLCFSVLRCGSRSPFWRRRSNCFSNFYSVLYYLIRKRRDIQKRRQDMSSMSVTSNGARGGHHRASDFIYASPYEFIDKTNDSEIYIPMSVSLRMTPLTPPPLPQRNNNYSPPPRMAPISASRSSPCTPEMTQAFPNCTPSPLIATKNNELQVSFEYFKF